MTDGSHAGKDEHADRHRDWKRRSKKTEWVYIGPEPPSSLDRLWEIFRFMELLGVLTRRHISIRYKQTMAGASWLLLQPLIMMTVFSLVFGYFARFPTGNTPYHIFVIAGYIHWQFIARCVSDGSGSLVSEQGILSRVYFPPIIVPLSFALAALFDLAIMVGLYLLYFVIFHHQDIHQSIVYLPVYWFLLVCNALGLMLWASMLNVRYRDIGVILPFIVMVMMFLAPVVYPVSFWPPEFAKYLMLNPLAGVMIGIHWCLFGGSDFPAFATAVAAAGGLVFLVSGFVFFNRFSKHLGDYLS